MSMNSSHIASFYHLPPQLLGCRLHTRHPCDSEEFFCCHSAIKRLLLCKIFATGSSVCSFSRWKTTSTFQVRTTCLIPDCRSSLIQWRRMVAEVGTRCLPNLGYSGSCDLQRFKELLWNIDYIQRVGWSAFVSCRLYNIWILGTLSPPLPDPIGHCSSNPLTSWCLLLTVPPIPGYAAVLSP